ncbi:MAG: rod shape-determining protein MreD [Candidatus Omnitrophica bacterium]|nr:rod shape-determining protein MreD [Candidatus Omnitrophota bacterium]
MKRIAIAYIIISLTVLAEQNILQQITVFGKRIELLIGIIIYFSLFYKYKTSLPLAIFAGFLKDVFSSSNFGLYTLIFTASSAFVNSSSRKILKDNIFIHMLYGLIMTSFMLSCLVIFHGLFLNKIPDFGSYFKESILPKSIINFFLAPVIFKVLSRIIK